MPRKTETLSQALDAIRNLYTKGHTSEAKDACIFILTETLLIIAERLHDIQSHMSANLERAAKTAKKES